MYLLCIGSFDQVLFVGRFKDQRALAVIALVTEPVALFIIFLEKIAAQVEDPATPLDDIAGLVKESRGLIEGCREYLRSVRENIESA